VLHCWADRDDRGDPALSVTPDSGPPQSGPVQEAVFFHEGGSRVIVPLCNTVPGEFPTAREIAEGYFEENPRLAEALDLLGMTFEDYVRAIEVRMPPRTYTSCMTAPRPA